MLMRGQRPGAGRRIWWPGFRDVGAVEGKPHVPNDLNRSIYVSN